MYNYKSKTELYSAKHIILLALLFFMLGTLLELYLLGHFQDTLQLIPILCIGIALINFLVLLFRISKLTTTLFKLILVLTSLFGIYGVVLHLKANYEFEQDMKPTANSWDLFSESLSGALPTLAPLSMVVLALIGYSYLILLNQKQ